MFSSLKMVSGSYAAGGAGGGTTLTALRKADEAWKRLRTAEVRPLSSYWTLRTTFTAPVGPLHA